MTTAIVRKKHTSESGNGGEFGHHTRDESNVTLNSNLPSVGSVVQYKGAAWSVMTIDGDTFLLFRDGEYTLASERELQSGTSATSAAGAGVLDETLRRRRGHKFYPNMKKWPALYSTEDTEVAEKTVVAHYFGPAGDWYVTEANTETGEAFGYTRVSGGGGEWGYFSLPELEQITVGPFVGVERDLDHNPKSIASNVIAEYRA